MVDREEQRKRLQKCPSQYHTVSHGLLPYAKTLIAPARVHQCLGLMAYWPRDKVGKEMGNSLLLLHRR